MANCPSCQLAAVDKGITCNKCKKSFHWTCTVLTEFEIKLHQNNKYKPWRCTRCTDKYCIQCDKTIPEIDPRKICCGKCTYWYHLTCSTLTTSEYDHYRALENDTWYCKTCVDKYCKKCNLSTHLKPKVKCNICQNKYHFKCAGLTLSDKNKSELLNWTCRECYSTIFPFSNIDNNKLQNLQERKSSKYSLNFINLTTFANLCSVCNNTVRNPRTGLPCSSCKNIIHVKCSKTRNLKNEFHTYKGKWECLKCIEDKYPFTNLENNNLEELAFNSNITEHNAKFMSQVSIDEKLKLMLSYTKHSNWYLYSHPETDNVVNIENEDLDQFASIKPNFDYYDVKKFQSASNVWKKQNSLGIFHTNICSLRANIDKVEDLMHDLSYQFEILALTECWNPEKKKENFSAKHLDGYHEYYGTTGTSNKGGCGVYIKDTLTQIPRKDLDFKITEPGQEVETCWIELVHEKSANSLIGIFYRHPSKKNSDFFIKLIAVLKKVNREKKKVTICGDFNFDLLNYDKDSQVSSFLNTMLEHDFRPCISEPTRITNANKPSLVDNIFSNTFEDPISGNILEHISYDHLPNFAILHRQTQKNKITYTKRDKKNFDPTSFNKELLDPSFILQLLNNSNTNDAYNTYHNKYLQVLNKHIPLKKLSKKEVKLRKKPWLTPGLLTSINKKRALLHKFKNEKMRNKDTSATFQKYKEYNNLINKLKRMSKRNFYHKFFNDNSNNTKNIWRGINQLLNRKKSKQGNIFLEENGLITDPLKVANKFNEYFINIADKLCSKIANKNNKFQDYLKNPNRSSLFLKETTPDEIIKIINGLDLKKSSDIYDISPELVKLSAQPVAQTLTIIFNMSINEGCFPEALKTAKVIPLHKGESVLTVSNYRPISLLPIFSKIFERLIFNRLTEFIEKKNILTKNQFGFQKNKSTELAVTSIISRITNANDNKESSYCIFLDFAKAFDTVNHDILLEKLKHYGIKNKAFLWFKSYLSKRTQYTQIGDKLSDVGYIKHGVPQGSILGPLLFLLYINDITEASSILKFFLFADDTTVFYSDKTNSSTEETINKELEKVSNWLAANKLSLNVKKSIFMHFHYGRQKKSTLNIKINNTNIEEKDTAKYLGTLIDNKLNWKSHTQFVKTKLSRAIGIISKIRYFSTEDVLLNLYYSFVQSHINYNLLNWSCANKTTLNPISVCLKRVIRVIQFENKYEHTAPLFKNLKILPLEEQIKHKQAIFMWKLSHNLIPPPVCDLFNKLPQNPNKFHLHNPRTEHGKRLIIYSAVKSWNTEVPLHLKSLISLKNFNVKYKEYLLNLIP